MTTVKLIVNGRTISVDTDESQPLLWVLRDQLKLKGTKYGCGIGQCGACTVHVDGSPVRSCQVKATAVSNRNVLTIEGVGQEKLHAVQQSWINEQVPQCGYCQSGQIMSAIALLTKSPNPTEQQILESMNGNLCRCGTYDRIKKAIRNASSIISASASNHKI